MPLLYMPPPFQSKRTVRIMSHIDLIRNEETSGMLYQQEKTQIKQKKRGISLQIKCLQMQNSFYNQKNARKEPQSPLHSVGSSKQESNRFNIDDYSDSLNQLNVAFIAQQSKLLLSDSQSVVSEGLSISGISVIRNNSQGSSPVINFKLEEEFSGMQDWSVQNKNNLFMKRNLKRPNPSIDEQENEEQVDNRCTKRKMNEKMKVLTINPRIKTPQKNSINQSGYLLRSRAKAAIASESSSNEQLREMIKDIEQQEEDQKKTKLRLK